MAQRFELGLFRELAQGKCQGFLSIRISGIGMVTVLSLLGQDIAPGAIAAKSKASSVSAAQFRDQTVLFVDDDAVLYRSGTRRVIQQPRRPSIDPIDRAIARSSRSIRSIR